MTILVAVQRDLCGGGDVEKPERRTFRGVPDGIFTITRLSVGCALSLGDHEGDRTIPRIDDHHIVRDHNVAIALDLRHAVDHSAGRCPLETAILAAVADEHEATDFHAADPRDQSAPDDPVPHALPTTLVQPPLARRRRRPPKSSTHNLMTMTSASRTIPPDIFDVPAVRSRKVIGNSTTFPPMGTNR